MSKMFVIDNEASGYSKKTSFESLEHKFNSLNLQYLNSKCTMVRNLEAHTCLTSFKSTLKWQR